MTWTRLAIATHIHTNTHVKSNNNKHKDKNINNDVSFFVGLNAYIT